jgi:predicted phage tail protein
MYLVGDADRERGLELLRRHYADGRLSVEELDVRVDAVAGARTTTDLRRALRDLPGGRALSTLVPRVVALRQTPLGEAVARRVVRLVLAAALFAAWLVGSLLMLATLGIAMLVAGVSAALAAAFVLPWVVMSWLLWRIGHAAVRRR